MKTKNFISRLIMSLAAFLIVSFASSAQSAKTEKTPEERAKAITEKMKTTLELTDEQYAKIYDINLKYATNNDEIIHSSSSRMSKFKSLKAANEDKNKEIKPFLTETQFIQYKAMQKELKSDAKKAYKEKRKTE